MSSASEYLLAIERRYPGLLATSEGRRLLTKTRPKLFALVYLSHHLSDPSTAGQISFGEQHEDWYRHMLEWVKPTTEARQWRKAYVAPRQSAKSTVWFLIAPMWAAAHGHAKFIAALGETARVAETHLGSFVQELRENGLLRKDYPDLCTPKKAPNGRPVADSKSQIQQDNGFIFTAHGMSGTSVGLKIGNLRPDVIILDDIEPPAESYSVFQMEQRLESLRVGVLPLSANARVVLVGTVLMDGSIIHQLVQSVTQKGKPASWIAEERFACHYYPALYTGPDGDPRSVWPEKWSVAELESMKHSRAFAMIFQNQPMSPDGSMWNEGDIVTTDPGEDVLARCRHLLSVDPAVTSKTVSDATGVAWLSHDRVTGKVYVRQVWALRLDPKSLRTKVGQILAAHPEIRGILVETNQGGDVWTEILTFPGVRYNVVHQSVKKEVRAGWLLNGYQKREVVHADALPTLDAELLAFPRGLHDDLVDAVGSGYRALTGAGSKPKTPFTSRTV